MYYVDDVKCEGPGGELRLGICYRPNGTVCLIISGYQGQNGGTWFLSSEEGHKAYNGSLAVKRVDDPSCYFVIDTI